MNMVSGATTAAKDLSKHDSEELPHSDVSAGRVFSYGMVLGWLENHDPYSIPDGDGGGLSMLQEIQQQAVITAPLQRLALSYLFL